jgi:hypothetical protein
MGFYLLLALIALLSMVYLQPSVSVWKGRHTSPTSHHPNNHDRYDFDYHPDSNRQRAHEIERDVEQENHDWKNREDVKGVSEWSGDGTPSQQDGEGRDLDRLHNYGSDSDPDSKDRPLKPLETIDPESIVLYRILGNDLPPRHRPGQTLSNVRFILEHEPEFNNTRKLWVLNRIVDPHAEESIIQLLDHHRQEYIRIPFEEDEYLKQDFRLEDFPEPDFFSSDDYSTFSKVAKLRVLDYTYHDKNKYAMNNVSVHPQCLVLKKFPMAHMRRRTHKCGVHEIMIGACVPYSYRGEREREVTDIHLGFV